VNTDRLILISGWATDSSCWDSVINKIDRPVSCRHVNWWECLNGTVERNALLQVLEQEKEDVIVVGWSLGTLVALEGIAFWPDRVKSLVLISGTSRMTSQGNYLGVDPRALRAMCVRFRRTPRQVIEEFARLSMDGDLDYRPESNEFTDTFVRQARCLSSDHLKAGLRYLQEKDLRRILPGIGIPVRLLHGVGDRIIPVGCARYLQTSLPEAMLEEVQGGAHALLYTDPFHVAGFIRDAIDANFDSK
jgi:pimeloyl-[acyl-carrier protein] methyl ester esterase